MAEKKEKKIRVLVKSTITVGGSINNPLREISKLSLDSIEDNKVKIKLIKEDGNLIVHVFDISGKLSKEQEDLANILNEECLKQMEKIATGKLTVLTKSINAI